MAGFRFPFYGDDDRGVGEAIYNDYLRKAEEQVYGASKPAPQMAPSPNIGRIRGGFLDDVSRGILQSLNNAPRARSAAGGFAQGALGAFASARQAGVEGRGQKFVADQKAYGDEQEARKGERSHAARSLAQRRWELHRDRQQEEMLRSRPVKPAAPERPNNAYVIADTPEKRAEIEKRFPHMKGKIPDDGVIPRSELFNPPKNVEDDPRFKQYAENSRRNTANALADDYRVDKSVNRFLVAQYGARDAIGGLAAGNSFGDITAMKAYAKGTDPDTGVKEEEFNTIQTAIGTLTKLGLRFTSEMVGDGKLTSKGREYLRNEMVKLYNNRKAVYDHAYNTYKRRADYLGIDINAVVPYAPMDDDLPAAGVGGDPFEEVQKEADSRKPRVPR